MHLQPLPHLPQALDVLGLDAAVGHRPDVEQEVGVGAGRAHQVLHEFPRALVPTVLQGEAPGAVDRLAGLSGQRANRGGVEPGSVRPRQVLLEHLEVLAGKRQLVMIAADERGRLQAVNQLVRAIQAPVLARLVPLPVEPDAADRSVVGQQLGQLAVHVAEVGVEVP